MNIRSIKNRFRFRKSSRTMLGKKGFTLIEVIIATSIFAIVGLIAVIVFVNVIRIQKRVALENASYEDARFMMERMAREIRKNTIDYEEYYNKLIENKPYGTEYGCYATRFYNPGTNKQFGAQCNDTSDPILNPGCVIDKTTLDINTGQNPFSGSILLDQNPEAASAFCDKNFANGLDPNCGDPTQNNHNVQDELYLIDSKGTEKTLFASKAITSDSQHALAILRLNGEDFDQDSLIEKWTQCTNDQFCCHKDFNCVGLSSLESTLAYDASTIYKGFVPISPTRTDVTSLKFYIAPLEDPRKAFAEAAEDIQQQPHVTVILTVQPSPSALQNYNGVIPTITLQTTITSRIYNEVKSYYGKPACTAKGY